ncbi:hypothetical protein GCM10010218_60340 [Streptomyces mashuensis]|uniref:DUF4142 domain-containing protein n=1 Tax=Streptomyces mashuensis TaxID=33904 RepID=A0A919EF86_9ACTN|nr:DUF4142 domain-containing protein [Streptomyces mashuensis]GHF70937.1 hypothetical protein GCM10010218_60340 [Streptomyces mashuensis]
MRSRQWAAAAVTALAVATATTGPAHAESDPGVTDGAFLKTVHQGNLAEIEAGHDAQKNGTSACVKNTGAIFVRDHTKLDGDVTALAGKLKVSLPSAPTAEQKQQLMEIRTKAGTGAYDGAWLSAQAENHRKTLGLIDQQIASGRNAQITAAAKAARPVVAMHLALVKGGVCHGQSSTRTVPAGDGGMAAGAEASGGMTGAVAGGAAVAGTLVAGATVLFVRRRRTKAASVRR